MSQSELSFDICAEDQLPLLLVRVTQLWRQLMDNELAGHGLSQAKWRTLATLSLYPDGLIQSELADELGIEGPSLVAMIDRLSRDQWVERVVSEVDRRCKIIRLTDHALPLIDDIRASAERIYLRTFAQVDASPQQQQEVKEYMLALRERLYENLPEKKRQQRDRRLS